MTTISQNQLPITNRVGEKIPGIPSQFPKLWSNELFPISPATAVTKETTSIGATLLNSNRKALIQRIYGLIKGAKAHWRNAGGEKEKFPLALPKNNDELVDEIMQMIEHYKKQEPELDENPPWL